jgi:hypothetical protein
VNSTIEDSGLLTIFKLFSVLLKLILKNKILYFLLGFTDDEIVNFDETCFYVDMPGNYTYDTVGSQRVIASTSGHDKVRMSCIFAATKSGRKLDIICLIARKTEIPGLKVPPNVIVVYHPKGMFITATIHPDL